MMYMDTELRSIESMKNIIPVGQYRCLVAKVVIFHLKDEAKNRMDLYRKVNKVLADKQLDKVSYNFIRWYENKIKRVVAI
jgi:hypothetical protein